MGFLPSAALFAVLIRVLLSPLALGIHTLIALGIISF
jgi:hypothetical protein